MNNKAPASAPSAYDVARMAGVSQSAVSRTFTKGASVSAKTRDKVLAAANELGYRPNLLARSLSKGRSKIVGVALGNMENPFYTVALETLSNQLASLGLHLLVFTATPNSEVDAQIDDMLNYRVDALILLSTSLSSSLALECRDAGIPVIFFNRTSMHGDEFCSVTGNNRNGAEAIADLLLDRGYRNIAFMAGYENSSTSLDREQAFNAQLQRRGAQQPIRDIGHFTRDGAVAAARRLLSLDNRPDAIFCANDHMALATIDVARYEFNLNIGTDIGIVGFDDIPMASWPSYNLTSYSQPIQKMAEQAMNFINPQHNSPEQSHAIVDGALQVRGSIRARSE